MQKNRAFTLIELLVVIAIIAILAAIVLVSLSTAQNRAKDARVVSSMNQLRVVAQSLFSSDGNYANLSTNAQENAIESDITGSQIGSAYTLRTNAGHATFPSSNFCAIATLPSGGFWCVDSTLTSEKDINGVAVNCIDACTTDVAGNCRCD